MTLIQLEYAVAVYQYGNFTVASKKSYVTQPTLSMQIQKLEDELGVLIFDRSKKPIVATQIGKKILEQAKVILNEAQRVKDIIQSAKGDFEGDFTIGIIPTITPYLLPIFLKSFSRNFPNINIHVEELQTHEIIYQLQEGMLDVGIAATPLGADRIIEKPLYTEAFVGYVPEGHRLSDKETISEKDLKLDDMLLLKSGHCFRDSIINICKKDKDAGINIDTGSFETLIQLSNKGFGMTLLPYLTLKYMTPEEKKLVKYFNEPVPSREVSVLYSESELKISLINALHQTIKDITESLFVFQKSKIISPLLQ